jgi:hypothetical protein
VSGSKCDCTSSGATVPFLWTGCLLMDGLIMRNLAAGVDAWCLKLSVQQPGKTDPWQRRSACGRCMRATLLFNAGAWCHNERRGTRRAAQPANCTQKLVKGVPTSSVPRRELAKRWQGLNSHSHLGRSTPKCGTLGLGACMSVERRKPPHSAKRRCP